jgi:hypothetical protein
MPTLGRIGFWSGLAAFTATVAYDVVQILQVLGVLHFPLDEIPIFGTSLCIVVPFVLEILALHCFRPTPHSLLWDFDALAYLAMGLTALLIIPALRKSGVERWVRFVCMAHVVATVPAGIVYFHSTYSNKLLLLGLARGITAPLFMLLLAVALRRAHTEGAA